MKKRVFFLALVLLLSLAASSVMAELIIPDVVWDFDVPMTEIMSEYAMLVNEANPLAKSFTPKPLVKMNTVKRATSASIQLQETAANAIIAFFEQAKMTTEYTYTNSKGKVTTVTFKDGMTLFLKSGYRSYGTQATTYSNYLQRNNNVDDGYVAKPGCSEHQTGLCADILNADYSARPTMTQDFKWTAEAQWMKENCADFGLILRFTEDGEKSTGIKFEPWHFRYVGKNVASYIMSRGITLEEFTDIAKKAMEDYEARGGNIQEWADYEYLKLNSPPESYILDIYDESGDAEISLAY